MSLPFIGRQQELFKLCEWITHFPEQTTLQSFKIIGPPGIGKATFLDEAWQRLQAIPSPLLWIRPFRHLPQNGEAEILIQCFEGSHASKPHVVNLLNGAKQALFQVLNDPLQGNWVDRWFNHLYTHVLSPERMHKRTPFEGIVTIFVFDCINAYPLYLKVPLQTIFLQEIKQLSLNWPMACLFTVETPYDEKSLFVSKDTMPSEVIKLSSFSLEDCKTFFSGKHLSDEQVKGLFHSCNGVPKKLLSGLYLMELRFLKEETLRQHLHWIGPEKRRWLFLGAHLKDIECEDLEVMLQDSACAKDAFLWLGDNEFFKCKKTESKGISIESEHAQALIFYLLQWFREEVVENLAKIKGFLRLKEKLGSFKSRQALLLLNNLKFFNEALLVKLFPQETYGNIKHVLLQSKNWFEKTPQGNFFLVPEIAYWANEYVKHIHYHPPASLKDAIQLHWAEAEESLQKDSVRFKESIGRQKKELAGLNGDLKKIHVTIQAKNEALRQIASAFFPIRFVGNSTLSAVFMVALGCLLLYTGVLFGSHLTSAYTIVGLVLILLGFFIPCCNENGPSREEVLRQEKIVSLKLYLEKLKLERNQKLLLMQRKASEINLNQRKLLDFQKLLEQPYPNHAIFKEMEN